MAKKKPLKLKESEFRSEKVKWGGRVLEISGVKNSNMQGVIFNSTMSLNIYTLRPGTRSWAKFLFHLDGKWIEIKMRGETVQGAVDACYTEMLKFFRRLGNALNYDVE